MCIPVLATLTETMHRPKVSRNGRRPPCHDHDSCTWIIVKADSHIACRAHAVALLCRADKGLECVFLIWFWEERHGQSMAWPRHGKCESDIAALCKSNGKDTF
jgi:hypothetical protein